MKKLLSVMMILVMVLCIAGCGSSGNGGDSGRPKRSRKPRERPKLWWYIFLIRGIRKAWQMPYRSRQARIYMK